MMRFNSDNNIFGSERLERGRFSAKLSSMSLTLLGPISTDRSALSRPLKKSFSIFFGPKTRSANKEVSFFLELPRPRIILPAELPSVVEEGVAICLAQDAYELLVLTDFKTTIYYCLVVAEDAMEMKTVT